MSSSLAERIPVNRQQKVAGLYAEPVKAAPRPKGPERFLREPAKDAIQATQKQGTAATDIGLSEGRLSAKLSDGTITLGELERLGVAWAVRYAEEVLRQHGALASPAARAREVIRIMHRCLDEVAQYLEHLS